MTPFSRKQLAHDFLVGLLSSAVVLGAATVTGCGLLTPKAPAPPGVSNFYPQAALVMNDFSSVLLNAQNLFTSSCTDGVIPATQCIAGQKAFGTIAESGLTIDALIQTGASQTSIEAQITALSAQVATMPAAFGIKNPQTSAEFTALVNTLTTMLGTVSNLVQGAK